MNHHMLLRLMGTMHTRRQIDTAKSPAYNIDNEEAPVWRNHHLAARQTTNLLKIDFGGTGLALDKELLFTLGQAFRLTGAAMLELDERELAMLDPAPDAATGQYQSIVLYDSLAGGSGHLAELSHPQKTALHREWFDRAVKLLTIDGDMPDSVRHREAIRRLLTSACVDSLLAPERTLQFLMTARSGEPIVAHLPADGIAGVLQLKSLIAGDIPETFSVWIRAREITGVPEGPIELCRWTHTGTTTIPDRDRITVLRLPQGGIAIGRWLYQRTTNAGHPHKVRLRNNMTAVLMELTDDEFHNLAIIATKKN